MHEGLHLVICDLPDLWNLDECRHCCLRCQSPYTNPFDELAVAPPVVLFSPIEEHPQGEKKEQR